MPLLIELTDEEKENRFDDLCQQAMIEELETRKAAKRLIASATELLRLGADVNKVAQITGLELKYLEKLQKNI